MGVTRVVQRRQVSCFGAGVGRRAHLVRRLRCIAATRAELLGPQRRRRTVPARKGVALHFTAVS